MANKDTAQREVPAKRVFTISPGVPFLSTFAEVLLDGEIIAGFTPDNRFELAGATIYLPTRRAARALGAALLEATGRQAALLPDIRTLGDDENADFAIGGEPDRFIAPPVGEVERLLRLAGLAQKLLESLAAASEPEIGPARPPAGAADAANLGAELAMVLDQLATEEIEWRTLEAFARQEAGDTPWADWWMLSLRFLSIVGEHWPQYLAHIGRLDPAQYRRELLDLRTRRYLEHGSDGPVIIAGSTGSIPATARLMAAVAGLENGAIVLPGVDRDLGAIVADQLADHRACAKVPALATHPQAGLSQLLKGLGLKPADTVELGKQPKHTAARAALVSRAMLPARWTDRWADADAPETGDLDGVSLIEAANENEEALALAIAMREALETEGKTAALVTPDRILARRVASELMRFGVKTADSAGVPLTSTRAFDFVSLLFKAGCGQAGPADYAALFKHPYLSSPADADLDRTSRLLEMVLLRDVLVLPAPGDLAEAVNAARKRIPQLHYLPPLVRRMKDADWNQVAALANRLDQGLSPLALFLCDKRAKSVPAIAIEVNAAIDALIGSDPDNALRTSNDGAALGELMRQMAQAEDLVTRIDSEEFAAVLSSFAAGVPVRQQQDSHPRIFIWGALEARLQHVDRVLLGGLNEGTWPAQGRNDAFLNRPMKAGIGLTLPERRIGQSAHDFAQLSGHAEVFYSRSERSEGTPTIASRWLQRLEAAAGPQTFGPVRQRGDRYLELARRLDNSFSRGRRAERPCPTPAVCLRPVRLSITEIEAWIRDPYAIFARHVLGLSPLPPLGRRADPMLRGTIYHAILERFVSRYGPDERSFENLAKVARETFREYELPGDVTISWLPRFLTIGGKFVEWENTRADVAVESLTEIRGELQVADTGFTLRGRADRIDLLKDGKIGVFDYKTGGNPTLKQARTLSPQLALEAAMARKGGFGIEAGSEISELAYVRLLPGDKWKIDDVTRGKEGVPAEKLARDAWENLAKLIVGFRDPEHGYISRRAPMKEADISGDFDHLARVREWMAGEDEDDG